MGKFNFMDIVALAKAGYTPADVRSLIDLSTSISEDKPSAQEPGEGAGQDLSACKQQRADSSVSEQNPTVHPAEPEAAIDYKKLYEESQMKLAEAQTANRAQNMQGMDPINNEETVADLVRGFM